MRRLQLSHVGYFLMVFPWLVITATATTLTPPHGTFARVVLLIWLWSYPLFWLASLMLTYRRFSGGNAKSAVRWTLIPLAWILSTVVGTAVAAAI